jgi:hypothetical protein
LNLKCILINPWVYDFAAMNLWSRPLGLIKVAEYMSQFELDMRLIDCIDSFKERRFGTGKYPREIVEKPEPLRSVPMAVLTVRQKFYSTASFRGNCPM